MSFVTQYMGLIAWDQGSDPYDHNVLSGNFQAIDLHDHTPGRGRRIGTSAISDGAVTTVKLADGSVTGPKIPNDTITNVKLADDSVGSAELQTGSVGTSELQDGSVTLSKLEPGIMPVGSIVSWFRPNTDVPLPSGTWVPLDGRAWSTVPNAWGITTGNLPDTRGKFIVGAATTNNGSGPTQYPDIGGTGGSHTKSFAHSHTVNAHTHTTPSHQHGIGPDGAHAHSIALDGSHNHSMHSRLNAFLQGIEVQSWTIPGDSPIRRGNSLQSLYVAGFNNSQVDESIPLSGAHQHGGATGAVGVHDHGGVTSMASAAATTSASPDTNSALTSAVDIRPAYIGFIQLIKVL